MVNRHKDAAYANAIINACPAPPLDFFGDLRELNEEDFSRNHHAGLEKYIEQPKHEEQFRIMQLSRKVHRARQLLADCKDNYGPLEKLFSISEIVGYLDKHTVGDVEELYKNKALASSVP